jgi:hypothetical protein
MTSSTDWGIGPYTCCNAVEPPRLLLMQEGFDRSVVRRQVNWLSVSFVCEQLATCCQSLRRAFRPFARWLGDTRLPFVSAVRR